LSRPADTPDRVFGSGWIIGTMLTGGRGSQ
jgi:hypothetical protein